MDLSVVIVNWNTRDLLRECLLSLRAATRASPLATEVIVVDNASADGSAEMVARDFPECRLIANQANRNYAAGSNQGIHAATGRLVLLLNPDTAVEPGAFECLAATLDDSPQAAAVAPALVHPDGSPQQSVRGFPTPLALLGDSLGLGRLLPGTALGAYRPRRLPQDRVSRVAQPMASALLIRREVLQRLDGFDEAFPLFFNDVDLCLRIHDLGLLILYDPRARVTHVGGASTGQVRAEAIRASHAGLERFYGKHHRRRLPAPVYRLLIGIIRVAGRWRAYRAERVHPRESKRVGESNVGDPRG